MRQIRPFGDERELGYCAHCGGGTATRDHVPSRVLLDRPYPENLPVVPCCRACNSSFSQDEEYLAVLVDCVLTGATAPGDRHRNKVRKILERRPALAALMSQGRSEDDHGESLFEADRTRVENVVLKLARGHAAFDLHSPQLDSPSSVLVAPLPTMTREQRSAFEMPAEATLLPEVGSRAMLRLFEHGEPVPGWIVVQEGRYRFMTSPGLPVLVRFVLSEFLACEVAWVEG